MTSALHAQSSDDIGYRDFSFEANAVSSPTGIKPQSKLWFNDGMWWGALFSVEADSYTIYRFDLAAQQWQDTGVVLDSRNSAHLDCLWDGARLYVAAAGPNPSVSEQGGTLARYAYDADDRTYVLEQGFPLRLTDGGTEALVLAKDSAGWLWITYTQHDTVYVAHSSGDDTQWTAPYELPFGEAHNLSDDDIASVVALGSQVAVVWSNQVADVLFAALHANGSPDDQWTLERALSGQKYVDDHIHLTVDTQGQLYAAVKTSLNDKGMNNNPFAPLILLLVRDLQGQWSTHPVTRVADEHTRPIVLLDEEHRLVFIFASQPCCDGGTIYYKVASMDDFVFAEGLGIPFMQSSIDLQLNNPTSTKQAVSGATGLLVLASDYENDTYYHNFLDLATYCAVRANGDAGLHSAPGNDSGLLGSLYNGQVGVATGQASDSSGQTWWQLATGEWLDSTQVTGLGVCASLPPASAS